MLASQIVACIPAGSKRLVEPFAGSAAISLATAYLGKADTFWINDINKALISLWKAIITNPESIAEQYRSLWVAQVGKERSYYDYVRQLFNETQEAHYFLYLLARCVKAAIRYNKNGEFNNSPDNRRRGMHPDIMQRNIISASQILRGKTTLSSHHYTKALTKVAAHDVVYLDPPYQGVSDTRDHRYYQSVKFDEFANALDDLNKRNVAFIVSYDGRTGDKVHGKILPEELELIKHEIHAGRSTQATLLGRDDETYESLYLSRSLVKQIGRLPETLKKHSQQLLFS